MEIIAAAKALLDTLLANAANIRQECLLDPAKVDTLKDIHARVQRLLPGEDSAEVFEKLDAILRQIESPAADALPQTPPTSLIHLKHGNKEIILSDNVPRPQAQFSSVDPRQSATPMLPAETSIADMSSMIASMSAAISDTDTYAEPLFVDSEDVFTEVRDILNAQAFLAIDIENHSFRSYSGFVCLLQIATLSHIYIIDAIALRHRVKELSLFENPSVLKVMHGADCDVLWLQRDYNISIASLFDTQCFSAHAFPGERLSLLHIVLNCTGEKITKAFQLADWRIRPLPQGMLTYAANDVKYLFRVAKILSQHCATLHQPIQASHKKTMKMYSPPKCIGAPRFARKYGIKESAALENLLRLRDFIAKEEDENPQFILSNQQIRQIFTCLRPLETQEDLLRLLKKTSPLLKSNMTSFMRIICGKSQSVFDMGALKDKPKGRAEKAKRSQKSEKIDASSKEKAFDRKAADASQKASGCDMEIVQTSQSLDASACPSKSSISTKKGRQHAPLPLGGSAKEFAPDPSFAALGSKQGKSKAAKKRKKREEKRRQSSAGDSCSAAMPPQ